VLYFRHILKKLQGGQRLLAVIFLKTHTLMADEDSQGESRSVRPRGGPNAQELSKSKNKYKSFDKKAQTEYERLVKENKKKELKPTTDAVQHATFHWLCTLREGAKHSYNFIYS
jgi:hypothetical protein